MAKEHNQIQAADERRILLNLMFHKWRLKTPFHFFRLFGCYYWKNGCLVSDSRQNQKRDTKFICITIKARKDKPKWYWIRRPMNFNKVQSSYLKIHITNCSWDGMTVVKQWIGFSWVRCLKIQPKWKRI